MLKEKFVNSIILIKFLFFIIHKTSEQEWTDAFLKWNPDDFGGLKKIRIPCRYIWLPDIVLYNSADDYTQGYMQSLAMIDFNGTVFWPPIVKFRSTCKINITW